MPTVNEMTKEEEAILREVILYGPNTVENTIINIKKYYAFPSEELIVVIKRWIRFGFISLK